MARECPGALGTAREWFGNGSGMARGCSGDSGMNVPVARECSGGSGMVREWLGNAPVAREWLGDGSGMPRCLGNAPWLGNSSGMPRGSGIPAQAQFPGSVPRLSSQAQFSEQVPGSPLPARGAGARGRIGLRALPTPTRVPAGRGAAGSDPTEIPETPRRHPGAIPERSHSDFIEIPQRFQRDPTAISEIPERSRRDPTAISERSDCDPVEIPQRSHKDPGEIPERSHRGPTAIPALRGNPTAIP